MHRNTTLNNTEATVTLFYSKERASRMLATYVGHVCWPRMLATLLVADL